MTNYTGAAAALVLAAACCCSCVVAAAGEGRSKRCQRNSSLVIGISVGPTLMERSAAAGFQAAFDEATAITRLPGLIQRYSHDTEDQLVANVQKMVTEDCAFIAVGRPGNSTTEDRVLSILREHRVPLVGFVSGSEGLRDVSKYTAKFLRSEDESEVMLPLVVNVRGSETDELNIILTTLSRDLRLLANVSLVAEDTTLGRTARNYTHTALRNVFNKIGLLSSHLVPHYPASLGDLEEAEREVFGSPLGQPQALIVATAPETTKSFVDHLARSGRTGLTLFMMSWSSALDLSQHLGRELCATLQERGFSLYFTQTMPFPSPAGEQLARSSSLIKRFNKLRLPPSMTSHSALEGYLTGWFIYVAAQKAAARVGVNITQGDFLNTIFVDVRTFSVQGVTLGPYGDGGLSGVAEDTQSSGDACNQGVHEVFMIRLNLTTGREEPVPGGSFKFPGCTSQKWAKRDAVTFVGSIQNPQSADDMVARAGMLGADQSYGAQFSGAVLLKSASGSIAYGAQQLNHSETIVVVYPKLSSDESEELKDFAVVSPMPGLWSLRRPFDKNKNMVNLFPSSYDEVQTAIEFFNHLANTTNVAVIQGDDSDFSKECTRRLEKLGKMSVVKDVGEDVHGYMTAHPEYQGFFILGGKFNPCRMRDVQAPCLLSSQVIIKPNSSCPESVKWADRTFRLSVSPPITQFASTSPLRTDYSKYVSSEDAAETSFRTFFVGKFLAQVIDKAKRMYPDKTLTHEDIIEAVYEKSSFTIEDIKIGPFKKDCTDDRDCCNQGLNTVYVLRGPSGTAVEWQWGGGKCGQLYIPLPNSTGADDRQILGFGLGIGLGGAMLCAVLITFAIWKSTRTHFFNIRRGELELGKCMGQGRFGSMYMADWHGTTVAVRMIDKKATPKEDQRLIKEEVLLLHKHHHPNLLMLMGYCETRNEIFVVTEFMEGGTVSDFLARGKPFVQIFTLISMAFDVLKGIAYLHSCKPPIVHGSISTHNLLIDGQGTVKVSDLWYGNKRGLLSSSGSSSKALSRAAWQPPEVIAGSTLTPATDVYAFGIVLWELIAPPDMTMSSASATSGTPSAANSSSTPAPASAAATPGMVSITIAGVGEMSQSQIRQTPEIPSNAPAEVADLLERCWHMQPERRPSVFQILRSWPTTFASLGKFEVPQDLETTYGTELSMQISRQSTSTSTSKMGNVRDLNDEMVVSMASFMPVNADSDALQMPQAADAGLYAMAHLTEGHAAPQLGAAVPAKVAA
eukprot:m51a1_g8817 putative flag-tagged protein kinase domain of mitogen-activated protein kinase kinase kinase (1247) ;mRNA; f:316271-320688